LAVVLLYIVLREVDFSFIDKVYKRFDKPG
jgi:hypothetical protein